MQPGDPHDAPRRHSLLARLVRLVVSLIAAVAVVVMLLTVAGFAARIHWRCEQACHFRVQYFWLLAVGAIVLALAKRSRLAAAAGVLAIVNVIVVVNIYWPSGTVPSNGPPLKLIAFNVLGENDRREEVVAYLRREQADIVLLMEVQPAWVNSLESLSDAYPHRHVQARSDNFGIALLSREPLKNVQTRRLGSAELPTIVAELEHAGRPLQLIGVHPLPPGTASMSALRNDQLVAVASLIQQQTVPIVLAGDLNSTSYSPYFEDLCSRTGLRDSRQGFGIQASWSPRLPLLEICIDHCLVPPAIHVANRRAGPHLGSDHRPIMVTLTWTGDAQQ